jgi:hypothetical protein
MVSLRIIVAMKYRSTWYYDDHLEELSFLLVFAYDLIHSLAEAWSSGVTSTSSFPGHTCQHTNRIEN